MEENLQRVLNKFASIYKEESAGEADILSRNIKTSDDFGFPDDSLKAIQNNFHDLMWYRCRNAQSCLEWLHANQATLPEISSSLLRISQPEWFPIPGMYGGFSYRLLNLNDAPALLTESWIRVVGGSGERHIIAPDQITLVEAGFV